MLCVVSTLKTVDVSKPAVGFILRISEAVSVAHINLKEYSVNQFRHHLCFFVTRYMSYLYLQVILRFLQHFSLCRTPHFAETARAPALGISSLLRSEKWKPEP